jgi:hypothetical protein
VLRHARNSDTAVPAGGGLCSDLCKYRPPNPAWFVIFIVLEGWCRHLFLRTLWLQDFAENERFRRFFVVTV